MENYDNTHLMAGKGHARYCNICGPILRQIGFDDVDLAEVEKEEATVSKMRRDYSEEDPIPTDDLLGATELSARDVEEQVGAMQIERAPPQQGDNPKATKADNNTNLIGCDIDPAQPDTSVMEDQESDEEINERIAMVDLYPEPIL
ncbi:MAG: hypothetical protein Q9208_001863 [Pyrenodesmia sp. 3 TL-2023]